MFWVEVLPLLFSVGSSQFSILRSAFPTLHSQLSILLPSIHPVLFVLHAMPQLYFHAEFIFQMAGDRICCIYTSMLATGTTEAYHQTAEPAFDVIFYGDIYDAQDAI